MNLLWDLQNQHKIQQEIAEVRRLLIRAETIICSNPDEHDLCQGAKVSRQLVHDTLDSNNVKRGVELLNELVSIMKKRQIEQTDSLEKEIASFAKHSECFRAATSGAEGTTIAANFASLASSALSEFFPGQPHTQIGPAFDNPRAPTILNEASEILAELRRNWSVGPYYVPLKGRIAEAERRRYEYSFSAWSDSAWSAARACLRELVGLDTNPFFGPTLNSIYAFDTLRAACNLALADEDDWAAPLIRCLIAAAHELRQGSSTGRHGSERLRAKLIVGRLIGELSRFDFQASLTLADLTVESVSFSRSQVLYEHATHPDALRTLIEVWSKETHPVRLDVLAQAFVFAGEQRSARDTLKVGKKLLRKDQTQHSVSSRTEHWEWSEKKYSVYLQEIYFARLARTLSLLDIRDALKWSEQISLPPVSLGCRLWCLTHGAAVSPALLSAASATTRQFAEKHGLQRDDVSLVSSELSTLPFTRFYPDFPAEQWEELTSAVPVTCEDVLRKLRD